jgi:hypothetical protein
MSFEFEAEAILLSNFTERHVLHVIISHRKTICPMHGWHLSRRLPIDNLDVLDVAACQTSPCRPLTLCPCVMVAGRGLPPHWAEGGGGGRAWSVPGGLVRVFGVGWVYCLDVKLSV